MTVPLKKRLGFTRAAKRAFECMMTMTKIDIAKIEAARRG
jgi:predicted 3-demethylubiquinone-9 3-methyltransferase (glyoxalase superfamily)